MQRMDVYFATVIVALRLATLNEPQNQHTHYEIKFATAQKNVMEQSTEYKVKRPACSYMLAGSWIGVSVVSHYSEVSRMRNMLGTIVLFGTTPVWWAVEVVVAVAVETKTFPIETICNDMFKNVGYHYFLLFDSNFQHLHNCGHRSKTLLYSWLHATLTPVAATTASMMMMITMMRMVKSKTHTHTQHTRRQ